MTREDLRSTFERLAASRWMDVPGVSVIEGAAPGVTAAITACTHGNEPAGLAAIAAVLALADGGWRPRTGRVVLAVNNLAAATRWFAAADDAARLASRFVETDMNRLPRDVLARADADAEGTRARALAPVWRTFDAALDVHTTQAPSPPMIVAGQGAWQPFARGMPIATVIAEIAAVQIGVPAFALYAGTVFEIEAGSHDDPAAWALAAECAWLFLANAGLLDHPVPPDPPREVYTVCGAVRLPDASYELAQVFPTFHPVRRGDVIARGAAPGGGGVGPDLSAPMDGHILFAPQATRPPSLANETLFLTLPVRREEPRFAS